MTAKEFLKSKGIYSLDTKKRTDEVLRWMEEYAKQENQTREQIRLSDWLEGEFTFVKSDVGYIAMVRFESGLLLPMEKEDVLQKIAEQINSSR